MNVSVFKNAGGDVLSGWFGALGNPWILEVGGGRAVMKEVVGGGWMYGRGALSRKALRVLPHSATYTLGRATLYFSITIATKSLHGAKLIGLICSNLQDTFFMRSGAFVYVRLQSSVVEAAEHSIVGQLGRLILLERGRDYVPPEALHA